MDFSDYGFSLRFRDMLKQTIRGLLDTERPKYRYGVVQSVDYLTGTAGVTLTGDGEPILAYTMQTLPRIGDRVRVEGHAGDKFISAVAGVPNFGRDLGAIDINTIQEPGTYQQGHSFNGSLARGYPRSNSEGVLEVFANYYRLSSRQHTVQRFTDINRGETFIRTIPHSIRSWTPWRELSLKETPGVPYATAAGVVTIPSNGTWSTFNLPAGRFSQLPIVTGNLASAEGFTRGGSVRILPNTLTEARVHVSTQDGGISAGPPVIVHWIAVQMTSSSASG